MAPPGRPTPPGPPPTQQQQHRQPAPQRHRPVADANVHRVRSGITLLAISIFVGIVSAGLIAVAIGLAALALKRAVG